MLFYGKSAFPLDGWVEESIIVDREEENQRENEIHFNSRKSFDYRFVSNEVEYVYQNGLKENASIVSLESPNDLDYKPGDKVILKTGIYFVRKVSIIENQNIGYAASLFGESVFSDYRIYRIEMEDSR